MLTGGKEKEGRRGGGRNGGGGKRRREVDITRGEGDGKDISFCELSLMNGGWPYQ